MIDQTFDIIKKVNNLYELRLPLLFFGFALWVVVPILGIFPLLLSIQLYLITPRAKKPKLISLTNVILLLVVLTVSIYASSFEVFADTQNYLDVYEVIDTKGIFDNQYVQDRFEIVPFAFFYAINILTNGSEYLFLLLFSLSINSLVVFWIGKNFSPQYYPSLLILVFSTFFYYSHIFYMRQFLSVVLMLMAIIYLESSWLLFIFWSVLALFSHFSTALYIAVCVGSKTFFWTKKKLKLRFNKSNKIFLYILLFIAFVIIVFFGLQAYNNPQIVYSYVSSILELLPQKDLSSSIQGRVTEYDGRDTDLFSLTIFRIIAIACVGSFYRY